MTKLANAYKWLWTHVGGRPWTYIIRDIYHQVEWVNQMTWFVIGGVVGMYFGWPGIGVFIVLYTLGYLNGHFHWGTKYIPNQRG